jgi:TonB family protein
MNRMQKKCVVASTGFHLLLVLILFIGPAFLSSNKESENRPLIDFIPLKTIDEALAGGGTPNPRPPQAEPQPPAPQPPTATPQPEQVKPVDPPKPQPRDPDSFDTKPAKKLPDVSLKKVTRPKDNKNAKQQASANANAQTDQRETQLAKAAQNAARTLREGLSSSTNVELPDGPGGGGMPYANFLDALKKIYTDAWLLPDGVTDDSATATASVTIARDGRVLDARVIAPSGNALADQSVEAVLRRVTHAVPLPEGAKESQRTVKIKFNVKAKLLG